MPLALLEETDDEDKIWRLTCDEIVVYTQTFAQTALGSWPLGTSPLPGTIGLGSIQGQVGVVKSAH